MIRNLGQALTILARQQARESDIGADLAAFHAPGECFDLAFKKEAARARRARKHAEAIARRPYRIIAREARQRGCDLGGPRFDRLIGRLCAFPG